MKGLLALVVLSIVSFAYSEVDVKVLVENCRSEFNVSPDILKKVLSFEHVPNEDDTKCMVACYLKKVGMILDGKLSPDGLQKAHQREWSDATSLEKIVGVDKKCIEEVGTDESNECEIAYKYATCFMKETKAVGVPAPTSFSELI